MNPSLAVMPTPIGVVHPPVRCTDLTVALKFLTATFGGMHTRLGANHAVYIRNGVKVTIRQVERFNLVDGVRPYTLEVPKNLRDAMKVVMQRAGAPHQLEAQETPLDLHDDYRGPGDLFVRVCVEVDQENPLFPHDREQVLRQADILAAALATGNTLPSDKYTADP